MCNAVGSSAIYDKTRRMNESLEAVCLVVSGLCGVLGHMLFVLPWPFCVASGSSNTNKPESLTYFP